MLALQAHARKHASKQACKRASERAYTQASKQASEGGTYTAHTMMLCSVQPAGIHIQPILVGNRAPLQCIALKETPLLPSGSV